MLQAEELKNSVKQQENLVTTTKEELDMLAFQHKQNQENYVKQLQEQKIKDELDAMPVIQIIHTETSKKYEIINIGSPVINVTFIKDKYIRAMTTHIPVLKTSSIAKNPHINIEAQPQQKFSFKILFTTIQGIEYEQNFENTNLEHNSSAYVIVAKGKPEKIDIVDC